MEFLEKALIRNDKKILNSQVARQAMVTSINDIKRLIAELNPNKTITNPNVSVHADIDVKVDNKTERYSVSSMTRSISKRDQLIAGLDIIKSRIEAEKTINTEPIEINGVFKSPPKITGGVLAHSWVDPLITQWLGGKRDGLLITWELSDGYVYKYDIYSHKLTRILKNDDASPASTV